MQREAAPNRLRELRDAAGLKRHDIAVKLGVDPTTVYRWERGSSPMNDDVKRALSELLGVTMAALMGWEENAA